jgi:PAS domain S-box-containing protein
MLRTRLQAMPQLLNLAIVDANGRVIAEAQAVPANPAGLRETAALSFHRENRARGSYMAPPMMDRQLDKWLITISRRIDAPNGDLKGIVIATLDPRYFGDFYRSLELGKDGVIALLGLNGVVLVREPFLADVYNQGYQDDPRFLSQIVRNPSHSLVVRSPLDGKERVISYKVVSTPPMVAFVGLGKSEVLAAWKTEAIRQLILTAVAMAVVGGMAFLLRKNLSHLEAAADEARQAQEAYKSIFDQAVDGIYQSSVDGRWLRANPAFVRMNGYESEQALIDAFNNIGVEWYVDPDMRRRFQEMVERDGRVTNFEAEVYRRGTGERMWIVENARVVRDENGAALYYEGSVVDITDRQRAEQARLDAVKRERQAEQRMIEAIDSSSEGIIVYDADERFVVCNNRYRQLYPDTADLHRPGVRYEEILRAAVERGQFHLAPDVNREAFIQQRLARFRNPSEPIVRRIASGKWVQISERRTPEGGLISVRTDITALKDREGQLIESMEAAQAANRAKSTFLANISHELRTPLHAVLGLAEILRDNTDQNVTRETYRSYAKLIYDSGSHLLDLINDVLDMSKIEAGRYDLAEEQFSLPDVIESCIVLVARKAQEARVAIVNRVDRHVPDLGADRRAVKQVILNLLSNAVKFSRAGGSVTISATRDGTGGLSLSVTDTGIGISSEQLVHIAEPFWQGDDSHTRRYEGTGLGLAISRRLMELHGGALSVHSTKGVGTTVEIHFPHERALS